MMGIISIWSAVFILPQAVPQKVAQICRNLNFLWSAAEYGRKPPRIAWVGICSPKNVGGIGSKNIGIWNRVPIAKHLQVCLKKNNLGITWVHMHHLKEKTIWEYQL